MSKRELMKYEPPPKPETFRRVYMIPTDLLRRGHDYGQQHGMQTEAEIIRALLDLALRAKGYE